MDEITNEPSKKEAAKEERRRRKELLAGASAAAVSAIAIDQPYPISSNYGDVELNDLQSKSITGRKWTEVGSNIPELKDQAILIRGRVHTIRPVIKKMAFVVVRERGFTAQCVLNVKPELVSLQMVKFATSLSKESIVDIEGSVSIPAKPITGCTQQQVEVQISKLYCVNRAVPTLPINIKGAARSEKGEQLVRVNQDTRLNFRILDIRTPANQGIFRIQCQVENIFRQFLLSEGFVGIHTPKLIGGSSEGGSAVFRLDYKGQPACLAQSPQLHKQMAVCGDFGRYLQKTLRLTFAEGVQMLKEAGVEVDPLGDLNTESERKLGHLVAEKYGTEFYILHKYPQAVRPFYTMPCHDNPSYSNSFDVFIRGEEIISGAQRIHVPEFLEKRAGECGIDVKTISTYIDSFRYGAPPHGGFGVGLERVVMLFCALNNIRKTSLFPRGPQRIAP
ncbi:hypothetical protein P3S68_030760 [Capsicum galapagoense]